MNMLPLPFNNSEPSFKDLIEEQTDVFQISQLDIIDSLESIKKIQKDIFDISFKMYNLQEEQFELAKSQLFDQKEFMDEQRRALNNSGTDFGGDTSSNNNETVSKLPGGAGGGSNGMMGGALAGAGGGIGLGLKGLAFGLAAFANPATAIGGGVIVAFLAGLAGVSWLAGKGAQEIGKGFKEISSGIDALDETGKKVEMDNLVAAGKGLGAFLENVSSLKGIFGAVITFLTGDLVNIADGMNKLNTMNVDKEKLIAAGEGLNAFMSAMGEGSFFGKLVGSISTAIAPDMEKLASGVSKLSDVSKTFDLAKFKDMATGMAAIADPLAEFGKSGIVANFVGDEALSDIASGITALNNTQVDRLETVAKGIKFLDNGLWEIVKTAFAANFVGENSLKDIGDGISDLNKTEVDRLETVAKGIKFLDNDLWKIIKTAFAANFVGENALTDIAKGINYLNKTQVDRLETVGAGLETIRTPLLNFTGIGLAANFVGKNAIIDIADGAKDIMEKIGTDEKVKQAENVAKSLNNMREALSSFTTSQVWNTLKSVGADIIGIFTGTESPINAMISLSNEADNLSKTATALEKISKALNSFSGISFNTDNMDFEKLAKNLGNTIPLLDKLANGGVYKKIFGANIDFDKGILDPNLKLDQVAEMIKKVRVVLGFEDTKVTNVSNGTNNTSTNVSNTTSNTSTNVLNGTNDTPTDVPNGTDKNSGVHPLALEAKKRAARLKAADTNKDGELSRAELEALHAKESQERADLFGTTDLGAALDAGKLNTSTDVSNGTKNTSTTHIKGDWNIQVDGNKTENVAGTYNQTVTGKGRAKNVPNGTDNTSTNVSDRMDAYDAKLLALLESGQEITGEMIQDLMMEHFGQNVPNGTDNTSVTQLENRTGGEIPNIKIEPPKAPSTSQTKGSTSVTQLESEKGDEVSVLPKTMNEEFDYDSYKDALGKRESNNNYKAVNTIGYVGKYQFGTPALKDTGFIRSDVSNSNSNLKDPASWTGKMGVNSIEDFKNNPEAQEHAMKKLTMQNKKTLESKGAIQPGESAGDIAGKLAASHLLGAGGVSKNLREGIDSTDAYGTSGSSYMKLGQESQMQSDTSDKLMKGSLEGSGNSGNKNAAPPVIVDGRTFNNNSSTSAPASPSRPIEVAAISIQQKFSDYSTLSGYAG
jgi:hypothetical protein